MNPMVLRLLDANANRAREALRVWEDYARFVRNNPALSAELKQMRHELSAACQTFDDTALPHRDTPGDVGTEIKQPSELTRADLIDVVIAAGKRLSEALRSLEEFSKIDHPAIARTFEQLRYRAYDVEQRIRLTLGSTDRMQAVRLCVLLTESLCRIPWQQAAEQLIEAGVGCIQLREKTLEGGELLARASWLASLCRSRQVVCIINDRADVAMLSGADGVHVGQGDLPVKQARKLLGRDRIIGVSTHHMDQARQAVTDGADYIGVGPVFRSSTKPREILPGLDYARAVAAEIPIPAMAIAGITAANVSQVMQTGMTRVAVSSAILSSNDIPAAVRYFVEQMQPPHG